MSTVDFSNPLSSMLDQAFSKIDRNHDEKIDAGEFKSFFDILTSGIGLDKNNAATISDSDFFKRMDQNADGDVTLTEIQDTAVLMLAQLKDASLSTMIEHLRSQPADAAQLAAKYLSKDEVANVSAARVA